MQFGANAASEQFNLGDGGQIRLPGEGALCGGSEGTPEVFRLSWDGSKCEWSVAEKNPPATRTTSNEVLIFVSWRLSGRFCAPQEAAVAKHRYVEPLKQLKIS